MRNRRTEGGGGAEDERETAAEGRREAGVGKMEEEGKEP